MLSKNEVKADVQYIINGTEALTSFQDSLSYVTFLFWNGIIDHFLETSG